MSQGVNASPDDLRNLAKEMQRSAQAYLQIGQQLRRRLNSTSWQDSERQRFEAEMNETLKAIERFAQTIRDEHAPGLERRAKALDEYFRR